MASIDFCPLAKWVGEWRSEGRSWGRGIARPARSAAEEGRGNPHDRQARSRSGRDGPALAPGGRNRPRNLSKDMAALPPRSRSRGRSPGGYGKSRENPLCGSSRLSHARIVTRTGRNRLRVRSEWSGDRAVPKAAQAPIFHSDQAHAHRNSNQSPEDTRESTEKLSAIRSVP